MAIGWFEYSSCRVIWMIFSKEHRSYHVEVSPRGIQGIHGGLGDQLGGCCTNVSIWWWFGLVFDDFRKECNKKQSYSGYMDDSFNWKTVITTITLAVRLDVLGLHPPRSQCDLLYNLQTVFSNLGKRRGRKSHVVPFGSRNETYLSRKEE